MGEGLFAAQISVLLSLDMGIGSALWSVSRGLARNSGEYKRLLMAAGEPRWSCTRAMRRAQNDSPNAASWCCARRCSRATWNIDVVERWFPKLYPVT